jgi:hypothetical protein
VAARYTFSLRRESRMVLDLFSFFRRRCRRERWGRSIFVRLYVLDMAPGLLLPPKVQYSLPLYYGTHLPTTLHNCSLNLTSRLCPNTGNTDFVFPVDPSTARPVLNSLWQEVFHCLYIDNWYFYLMKHALFMVIFSLCLHMWRGRRLYLWICRKTKLNL